MFAIQLKQTSTAASVALNAVAAGAAILAVRSEQPWFRKAYGYLSGGCWFAGSALQGASMDPPRDDFTIAETAPEIQLEPGLEESGFIYGSARQLVRLAASIQTVVRTMERVDFIVRQPMTTERIWWYGMQVAHLVSNFAIAADDCTRSQQLLEGIMRESRHREARDQFSDVKDVGSQWLPTYIINDLVSIAESSGVRLSELPTPVEDWTSGKVLQAALGHDVDTDLTEAASVIGATAAAFSGQVNVVDWDEIRTRLERGQLTQGR